MADEEIFQLLAAGERAAFRGAPGQGIQPLQRAVALSLETRESTAAARARWLLGVCHNALGDYGQALVGLSDACAAPEAPTEYRALSAAAVASLFRQLGRHLDARDWDRAALEIAESSPEAAFDAWLGMSADEVGLARGNEALAALGSAEALVAARPLWWRQRIRADWVRAEIALLMQDAAGARAAAEAALAAAEAAGAPRHVAKSLLFAGVAAAQTGQLDLARDQLARAVVLAEGLGAKPLAWPSRAVLGAILAREDPEESARCLTAARTAIAAIAADLNPSMAAAWLARPDLTAIMY